MQSGVGGKEERMMLQLPDNVHWADVSESALGVSFVLVSAHGWILIIFRTPEDQYMTWAC